MNISQYINVLNAYSRQPVKIIEVLTNAQQPNIEVEDNCHMIESIEELRMNPYLDHLEIITNFNFDFIKDEDAKLVQMTFQLSKWKTPPPLKLNCASRDELRGNFLSIIYLLH